MSRYFTRPRQTRPRSDWEPWMADDPLLPHLSVDDHEAMFTGLLDDKGEEIWRGPNPMGFVWK